MAESEPPRLDLAQRLHNIEMILKATQPKNHDSYYNQRIPLLGKEISLGNVEKTDMMANYKMCWAILELFYHAQFDIAFDLMTMYQNDWKASMSISGALLNNIASPEYRYTQSQDIHEYQHMPQKKGIIFNRNPGGNKN